jgi:hypothetical protein
MYYIGVGQKRLSNGPLCTALSVRMAHMARYV